MMMRRLDAPERARGFDELLLLQREHLTAHDPRDVHPAERGEHDDDRRVGLRPKLLDRDREERELGHDQEQVGDAR